MIVDQVSRTYCLSAFFVLELSGSTSPIPGASQNSNAPTWVIGDAFLKNVYTIFRASPESVGFASLDPNVAEFGGIGESGISLVNGTVITSGGSNDGGRNNSGAIRSKGVGLGRVGRVGLAVVGVACGFSVLL